MNARAPAVALLALIAALAAAPTGGCSPTPPEETPMQPSLEQTRTEVDALNSTIITEFLAAHPGVVAAVEVRETHPVLADSGPWEARDAVVQYYTWSGVTLTEASGADGRWVVDAITAPLAQAGWTVGGRRATSVQECAQAERDGYNVLVCGDTDRPGFILRVVGPPLDVTAEQMKPLLDTPRAFPTPIPVAEWGHAS